MALGLSNGAGWAVQGVDVSSHDHNLGGIDWRGVANTGVQFAYVKATEGSTYTNPHFHDDYNSAKAAGILTGAYTYARPDRRTPVQDADYFMQRAEWANDTQTLIPFLDLEWPYDPYRSQLGDCWGLNPTDMVNWIRAFVDRFYQLTGRNMMIYTNTYWWNPCTNNNTSFGANPLDLSSYTTNAPTALPAGWSKFAIWQYAPGNPSVAGDFDRDTFNGTYAELTGLTGNIPASSPPFALLAHVNGSYVTAENAGNGNLIANRSAPGPWESFEIVDGGEGYIALRSRSNGRYVSADRAGAAPLIANRPWVSLWEQFTLINNPDGSISLKARVNGLFVTADNHGNGPLIAKMPWNSLWEQFDKVVGTPPTICLKAAVNGQYVSAEFAGKAPLIANKPWCSLWEQFDVINAGSGWVALRSRVTSRFVTAEHAGNGPLLAIRPWVSLWERFRLIDNGDGTVSLQAQVNGKYVSADNAGRGSLIANRPWNSLWERFVREG
jgi:GH25 family lysozyme M1 (1,4-beta-N-acetylmuramidase)